jgi:alpha-ribazole phosphatase
VECVLLSISIIRHGETEGNRCNLYQGWVDTPLSPNGIRQAEMLALRLKDYAFDRIYSSPLSRALKTACIINRFHGLEILKTDSIKEIHFGEWENMSRQQLEELYPGYMENWRKDWRNYAIPGGESLEMAYARINSWLDDLIKQNHQGRFAVVSHAGAIRIMVSHLVGRGIEGHWNFAVKNCSLTNINIINGFPVITLFNDVSHLDCLM